MDHIPNASLHEKFKIEEVKSRLLDLAKRQINKIVSDNLQHSQDLNTNIASLTQGQILWQDILS